MLPRRAAELAAGQGVTIYTIGIGGREYRYRTLLGVQRRNPAADLDEATLTAVAEATGGRYFRAHDTAELAGIYELLDTLEPIELDIERFRAVLALYPWPLGTALLLSGVLVWLLRRER